MAAEAHDPGPARPALPCFLAFSLAPCGLAQHPWRPWRLGAASVQQSPIALELQVAPGYGQVEFTRFGGKLRRCCTEATRAGLGPAGSAYVLSLLTNQHGRGGAGRQAVQPARPGQATTPRGDQWLVLVVSGSRSQSDGDVIS